MTIRQWPADHGYNKVGMGAWINEREADSEFIKVFVTPTDQWLCGGGIVRAFFKTSNPAARFNPALIQMPNGDHQLVMSS